MENQNREYRFNLEYLDINSAMTQLFTSFGNYMTSQQRFDRQNPEFKDNPQLTNCVWDADFKNWLNDVNKMLRDYPDASIYNLLRLYHPKHGRACCALTDGFNIEPSFTISKDGITECNSHDEPVNDNESGISYDKETDTLTIKNPNSIIESLGEVGTMLGALTK